MNNKPIVRLRSLQVTAGKYPSSNNVILHGAATTPCVALDRCSRRASTSPITPQGCRECRDFAWSKISTHELVPPASMQSKAAHQSGAVLIISLIMLLLLMLIGAAGMQTTMLEEKMAGNMRNRNLAFQAAESALRDAEQFIKGTDAAFDHLKLSGGPFQGADCSSGSSGLCRPTTTPATWSASSWTTKGRAYSGTTQIPKVAQQPRYVIELIRTEPSTDSRRIYATFRITAFAWGGDANAVVRLQTIYKLHANSFAY
jgi:type IV pilus assembly protein PilX